MSGLDAFVGEREVASVDEMDALGRAFGEALRAGEQTREAEMARLTPGMGGMF